MRPRPLKPDIALVPFITARLGCLEGKSPTVARLWADADAYAARVEAGRAFVMQACRPEHFAQRLERLQRG